MNRLWKHLSLVLALFLLQLLPTFAQAARPAKVDSAPEAQPAQPSGPPPLPRTCIGGGTPPDYNNPLCCVSGYVYLNGVPVDNATVTLSANGRSITVQTAPRPGSDHPYYTASLDGEPLNVRPGDTVIVQAAAGGQSKSITFTAIEGGLQADVVLPQSIVDAQWARADIPGRDRHALAYDAARGVVVLFGGYGYGSYLADTWEWDGTTWTQRLPPVSPPARYGHAMAYDAARGVVVLFGGWSSHNDYLADTWEWNGTTWTQRLPTVSPPARYGHALAYDAARGVVVLFGGNGNNGYLSDTWEWYGTTWTQRLPTVSPPARYGHALAYDAARGVVVLFGGYGYGSYLADTWEWNGTTWTQRLPTVSPPARYGHALAYDAARGTVVLFGGYDGYRLADTWGWDGTTWTKLADAFPVPARSGAALAYESAGQSLLFGGSSGGTFYNDTHCWMGNGWSQLTPATAPPARTGHRLARNGDGSLLLTFGGLRAGGVFLDDTWLWNGTDWAEQSPAARPPARANYGLTYDPVRNVWLLFGGQNNGGYLGDTWEFNGATWTQRSPAHTPPARSHATLTFDVARGRAVLIGGQGASGYLNDVWEWDGSDWANVTPAQPLGGRAGHGAGYDNARQVVVIAGGIGASGVLSETWEWNGSFWRQRVTGWHLPPAYNLAVDYDPVHDRLIAFGGQDNSGVVEGTYLHQVIGTPSDAPPVATIERIAPRDARYGIDTIAFQGRGQDADSSDVIVAYRWTHNGQVISTQATFTRPASDFPLGEQVIRFEVQDDEGTWSAPVEQRIYIRDGSAGTGGRTWTLLLYAAADNNLDAWMGDYETMNGMLYRLRTAGPQPNVNVAILYDGPGVNDTRRYILTAAGQWTRHDVGEARMDEMETLRDFIRWGYTTFPNSDYYALALIDHANGVVGIAQDLTSDPAGKAFLTPIELRSALQAATDDGARKIDVLHYDGCSFGLVETAAIASGLAHYVVSSPNTGWGIFAYDHYRQLAGSAATPRDYAVAVAQAYAVGVAAYELPYTIAALDMARFEAVNAALDNLGDSLLAYVNAAPAIRVPQLKQVRLNAQKYDSGGNYPYEPDDEDAYVDVIDLVAQLQMSVTDAGVLSAARVLSQTVRGSEPFILYESHASGQFEHEGRTYTVNLDRAHGLGIFYPPRSSTNELSAYQRYIRNQLFPTTQNSGWARFLAQGLPPQLAGDPPPMPGDILLEPLLPATPRDMRRLTVLVNPAQAGTVRSTPGAIQCQSACFAEFPVGTTVTLTATADPRYTFSGWSGACSGAEACVVTLDADRSVTALFEAKPVYRIYLPAVMRK